MLVPAKAHEGGSGAKSQVFVGGAQSNAESALRSTIQILERREDSSGELATALIKLGTLKEERGNHGEAEDLFRRALELGEGVFAADDPTLLPALTNLATSRILGGTPREAEPLLSRVLSISERRADKDQSDLAIVLNDLTRVCLNQSAYSLAEPLLVRLIAIKQSKGDNHPEVATVLASLAVVRQALGHHESAEQLLRRVLDIRERTLAPNHFSLARALEHLGESCAARGKFEEAVQLYQRAQTIRQLTLGASHPSLQISRERIADLQLQSSDNSLDPQAPPPPASPPDRFRLEFPPERRAISSVLLVQPTPQTPRVPHEKEAAGTTTLEPLNTLVVEQPARETAASEDSHSERDNGRERTEAIPYRDILLSMAEELNGTDPNGVQADQARGIFARVLELLRRKPQKVAIVGAGAMAIILLGAWAWDSKTGSKLAQADVDYLGPRLGGQPVFVAPPPASSNRSFAPTSDPLKVSTESRSQGARKSATANRELERARVGKGVLDRRLESSSIVIPNVSAPAMLHFDSVVKVIGAAAQKVGEFVPVELGGFPTNAQHPSFANNVEPANGPQRARLIGEAPTPLYPERASNGAEGEVLVRFIVDTEGRPMMSTFSVVTSPNVVLSGAVERVIPTMRFEPARSGGPNSKPVVDAIEVGFRFTHPAR